MLRTARYLFLIIELGAFQLVHAELIVKQKPSFSIKGATGRLGQ